MPAQPSPEMRPLALADIRHCLDGGRPSVLGTCAADGTPNVSVISDVRYVDDAHVALSFQFFNKTHANIRANPHALLQVADPQRGARYHLDLRYLRTETAGPLFEAMKAKLAGIASHVGMTDVYRLRGADVYAVLDIRCVVGEPAAQPRGDALLSALRAGLPLLRGAADFTELIDQLLLVATRLGFAQCMLLSADEQRQRLFTVGSAGYAATGVGAEIAYGAGVIGVAARERMPIRITHMARDYLYGSVVREQFQAAGDRGLEREIPLPGLADSRSQLAMPIVGDGRLLAVLYIESPVDGGVSQVDEEACAVLADQFADSWLRLSSLEQQAVDDPAQAAAKAAVGGEPLCVSHDPSDHSVFIDNEYLIKGVAGAVLWRMLGDYVAAQRVVFTNRELRRDPGLGLPEIADNLEARLVLLQRRLAERRPGILLTKIGRGRHQLHVERPLRLAML